MQFWIQKGVQLKENRQLSYDLGIYNKRISLLYM